MEEDDIDVESAEDVPDIGVEATTSTYDEGFHDSEDGLPKNDKREHHNLLERRRRDHIKDSFYGLRDCIPQLRGEKVSRAHILNKATEYIRTMQKCGSFREGEIVGLRLKNEVLEEQIQALETAKAVGSSENAEEILEAVQEKVEAKHKEQQKQTTKINSLVSERNEGDPRPKGVAVSGLKGLDHASNNAQTINRTPTVTTGGNFKGSDPTSILHNPPAISLLASNLKNTQSLLTALQKNLPPNSSLPANIKSLAQRVLASPLGRSQLQVTASSALRGIVTATTVPMTSNKGGTTPSTTGVSMSTPQKVGTDSAIKAEILTKLSSMSDKTSSVRKAEVPSVPKTTPVSVKVEPLTEGTVRKAPVPVPKSDSKSSLGKSYESSTSKQAALVSALTAPVQSQTQPNLSAQQILRTAHLLLQQQGSALSSSLSSPEKSSSGVGISQEMLAQVSSYLNIPTTVSSLMSSKPSPLPAKTSSGGRPSSVQHTSVEDSGNTPSFLTAALTSGMNTSSSLAAQNPLVSLALATEAFSHSSLPLLGEVKTDSNPLASHTRTEPKTRKRPASSSEDDDFELSSKKPRVDL